MEALFIYIGKVFLFSGVTFLYYQLSLKNKTFHHYNRFYLLGIMLVSILLPLVQVDWFTIELNDSLFLVYNKFQNVKHLNTTENDFSYYQLAVGILQLVAFVFIIRMLCGIVKIYNLKKRFPKHQHNGFSFYETNLEEAPFSFFRNLFWKNSLDIHSDLGKQILKHEIVHIEQKHSWDKIFAELITAVFWFNPFFYFIKKELYLIHEYLADKKAVKKYDTKAFAQMLLANHFGGNSISVASPFLSSNLKKRLQMLQKPKTKYSYARRILALPVVFLISFAYLVNAENKKIETEIDKNSKKGDTLSPKKKAIAEIPNKNSVDSLEDELKNATDDDVFLIFGKISSKEEFSKIFDSNDKASYIFFHSVTTYNPGKVVFAIEKANDFDAVKQTTKLANEILMNEKAASQNTTNVKEAAELAKIAAKEAVTAGKQAEIASKQAVIDAKQAQKDHVEAMKDANQAMKDAKQAMKDSKVAEKSAREAANNAKFAYQDSEKARKDANNARIFLSKERIRIESDKIRTETSDLTKIPAMERTKIPTMKSANSVLLIGKYEEDNNPEMLNKNRNKFLGKNSDFEVYIDGEKIENKDFNLIDVNKIKSVNVIKDNGKSRLDIQLK